MTRGALKRLWHRIAEPKNVTVTQTVIYAAVVVLGIATLLDPPLSVAAATASAHNALTWFWSGCFILGGLAGMTGAPTGKWMIEKPGITLVLTGLLIYFASLVWRLATGTGAGWVTMPLVIIAMGHMAARYFRIYRYSYEPGK